MDCPCGVQFEHGDKILPLARSLDGDRRALGLDGIQDREGLYRVADILTVDGGDAVSRLDARDARGAALGDGPDDWLGPVRDSDKPASGILVEHGRDRLGE